MLLIILDQLLKLVCQVTLQYFQQLHPQVVGVVEVILLLALEHFKVDQVVLEVVEEIESVQQVLQTEEVVILPQ